MTATIYRLRECAECGTTFRPVASHQEFCAAGCKRTFNNRRMTRGAELYDLWMTLRYERPIAKALGVWKVLCRLAWHYRDQDDQERNGRKSWRPARQVIERHFYVRSTSVVGRSRNRAPSTDATQDQAA